jgi:hypothetical protein
MVSLQCVQLKNQEDRLISIMKIFTRLIDQWQGREAADPIIKTIGK